MAVEHTFEFQASGASIEDVENVFISEFGNDYFNIIRQNETQLKHTTYNTRNLQTNLAYYNDYLVGFTGNLRNYIENTNINYYKFTPDFYISFRYGKNITGYKSETEETKIINCILKHFEGDAIYSLEHGMPRLWRRQGTLYLSTREKIWWGSCDFDLATLFSMPFEKEEMPFSFE